MTVSEQVLSYIKALTWPVITAIALIMFRDPIRGLLGGIEEFEGFGIKAKIRRQVSQATEDSLAALNRSKVTRIDTRQPRITFVVAANMQAALQFSPNLVSESGLPLTNPLPRMRRSVDLLDIAIIAVLVATRLPGADEATGAVWLGASPLYVENYMIDLTGYSGWGGVLEVRDILRGCLASLCGKRGRAVTSDEARGFASTAQAALEQLTALVDTVSNTMRG